jgi:L-2-hydroxyglutarate oxidase LhgO
MPDATFDLLVIGGGIVGLSTAMEMTRRFPRLRTVVLEKESGVARHQSGHNSGVIHSGLYYKPGSLKARLCVEGAAAMVEFCQRHGIAHEICGKVVLAASEDEIARLEDLFHRGQANGIGGLRLIGPEEVRELEPHCRAVRALHVPGTGITDYTKVCEKYAELIVAQGGKLCTGSEVTGFSRRGPGTVIETKSGTYATRYVINCAGLHSDRVSRLAGYPTDIRIVPFRGEYYDLTPAGQHLVRNLIYPAPDPRFPFLGVHFTRRITGGVEAGPNAVLALKREGYRKTDVSVGDALATLAFPGFWKLASRYWRYGLGEFYRSWSKPAFVEALQRLVPEVQHSDLVPGGSGVRAQALRRDGALVDDFLFQPQENMLHVLHVPSPAATASLAIGRAIVQMAAGSFGLN